MQNGEGNPWIFANIDGQWYAATYEGLKPGQICKGVTRRGSEAIGAHTDQHPLTSWVPDHGELVGLMVSGYAQQPAQHRGTHERRPRRVALADA